VDVNITKVSGKYGPSIDPATRALVVIDFEHHEIHDGDHFFYTDLNTLGSAGTVAYLLTVPVTSKSIHMTFSATGSAITQVDLYEDSDRVGTTVQTARNSDRNSSNVSELVIHKAVSAGTTDGTLIWTMKSGSTGGSSRQGMTAGRSSEIILKNNTKYLLVFTSGTADNLTNLQLEWYLHRHYS